MIESPDANRISIRTNGDNTLLEHRPRRVHAAFITKYDVEPTPGEA